MITFQSALVTALAKDCESGDPIPGIKMGFNDYGNHILNMGNTDAAGKAYIELFTGTNYKFRGYNLHTQEFKTADLVPAGITVEFNPTRVNFHYSQEP